MAAIIRCCSGVVDAAERRVVGQRLRPRRTTPRGRRGSTTSPIADTWLASRMPNRASSWRASEPAATRAAVSRALARSSTSRMSSWSYLSAPARSAWPGRGRVTGGAVGAGGALGHRRLDVHRLLPVHPVAVANQQRDRSAGGAAAAHAGEDLGAVALDLHPAAAAVAALPPLQLCVERVDVDREARRHAVHGHDERLAVGLASGEKSQHLRVDSIRRNCPIFAARAVRLARVGRRHGACTGERSC